MKNKLEKGDVITWLSDTDYSSGGGHVVIYDGKGGFFGNSSKAKKVIHANNYKTDAWHEPPKYIIKTGRSSFRSK